METIRTYLIGLYSQVDWTSEDLLADPEWLKDGADVILGTDIMFSQELAMPLAKMIYRYLAQDGHFYGASGANRAV